MSRSLGQNYFGLLCFPRVSGDEPAFQEANGGLEIVFPA